jgi:hypothetical protein
LSAFNSGQIRALYNIHIVYLLEDPMQVAVLIISLLWIVLGVLLILYTQESRNFLRKLFYLERVRVLAIIPLILGCILVIGAFYGPSILWLVLILGLLAVAKGLYGILGPMARIKQSLDWWYYRAEERTIRLCGLIIFILGLAVLTNMI